MKTLVVNEAICSRCGRPGGECHCAGRRPTHNLELVDAQSMELMTPPSMFGDDEDAERDTGNVRREIVLNGDPVTNLMIAPDMGAMLRRELAANRSGRRTEPRSEPATRDGLTDAERLMIPPTMEW